MIIVDLITGFLNLLPLVLFFLILTVAICLFLHFSRKEEKNIPSSSVIIEKSVNDNIENSYTIKADVSHSYHLTTPENDEALIYPDYENIPLFHLYKIKGKNPQTNRQKTDKIVVKEYTPVEIAAQKTSLLPPYTMSIDTTARTERPASDAQLEFAKELNIPIPSHCSMEDAHWLISRKHNNILEDYITPELLEKTAHFNVCLSPYTSPENGILIILHSGNARESLSFFSYLVYCFLHGIWHITTPEHCKFQNVFEEFADAFISDSLLLETINTISYEHICFLRSHGTPDKRNKKITDAFLTTANFLNSRIPTQTLSDWEIWKNEHCTPEQTQRQWRSYEKRLLPLEISPNSNRAIFQETSERYITSLSECTCPDFTKRHKPCKHMYRLAYELRNNN